MTYSYCSTPESLQRPPRTSWRVDQAECHSFRGRSGVWEDFPRCRLQRRDADDRDRGRPRDADAPGVGESLPCRGPAPSRVLRLLLLFLGPAHLPGGIHRRRRRIPAACSDGSPSQTSRRSSSPVNRNDQSGVSDFIALKATSTSRMSATSCDKHFNGFYPLLLFPHRPSLHSLTGLGEVPLRCGVPSCFLSRAKAVSQGFHR